MSECSSTIRHSRAGGNPTQPVAKLGPRLRGDDEMGVRRSLVCILRYGDVRSAAGLSMGVGFLSVSA
jgi:hypothetical protein